MPRCDSCSKESRQLTGSMTGRELCPACKDKLNATTAAMLAPGSGASTTAEVISTSGWLTRIRRARRQRN